MRGRVGGGWALLMCAGAGACAAWRPTSVSLCWHFLFCLFDQLFSAWFGHDHPSPRSQYHPPPLSPHPPHSCASLTPQLDACDPCAPPRVVISGPAVLTAAACDSPLQPTSASASSSSAAAVAVWDASASSDPAGRALAFTAVRWSVPEGAGSPGGRAVLAAAALRTNFAPERLVLALSAQEVQALEEGLEYRIQVRVVRGEGWGQMTKHHCLS